jgi:hypothetical protein
MVDRETEIEVVDLKNKANPKVYENLCKNIEQFFGRKIKAYKDGTSAYVSTEIKPKLSNLTPAHDAKCM